MRIQNGKILIENPHFTLTIGEDAVAESLILKATGEELLFTQRPLPFCTVTEERPYNNEIKLSHPNKRMTFAANRVRVEEGRLYVGFTLVLFEAVIEVCEEADFVTFRLVDFHVPQEAFGHLCMDTPPVESFTLLQLPFQNRPRFGEWINAIGDDRITAALMATSPYEDIDARKESDRTVLCANAFRDVRLCGCTAALIVSENASFLDRVARMEEAFALPLGVESRRNGGINRSALWTENINPSNVQEYIDIAKEAGLSLMLIYYPALFRMNNGYDTCGNYDECDLLESYPNGFESLREMLAAIRAAGILPGFHFLHTHIGIASRYVTPVADHRLRLKTHLTLARPLGTEDTVIYVEQSPHKAPLHEKCRVLQFGGEMISYESYTTTPPYCFTGCRRGHYNTNVTPHARGEIGGVADVCEFSATSLYLDQESSLQDEIAEKIARIYDAGFSFLYFDGSEGTSAPFNFHVSNAQYRVLQKLATPPVFCEGAAKTHFGWHWMSAGNAFDIFPAPIFKQKIVEHPFEEAPRMAQDFTQLNFGWWTCYEEMMPDMYEYGEALAFSYDCPMTIMLKKLDHVRACPRIKDNLEVFRRWEEARRGGVITEEQKLALRNPAQEHTLLINEEGKLELTPYDRVADAAGGDPALTAYVFSLRGRSHAVLWHTRGEGTLELPLPAEALCYRESPEKPPLALESCARGTRIPVSDKHYLSTSLSMEELKAALVSARLSE